MSFVQYPIINFRNVNKVPKDFDKKGMFYSISQKVIWKYSYLKFEEFRIHAEEDNCSYKNSTNLPYLKFTFVICKVVCVEAYLTHQI